MGKSSGVIGAGEHEEVRKASITFLRSAAAQLMRMNKVSTHPLPAVGRVHFYVLSRDGVFTTGDIEEQALGDGQHVFSLLFYAGHEVIGRVRMTVEKPHE